MTQELHQHSCDGSALVGSLHEALVFKSNGATFFLCLLHCKCQKHHHACVLYIKYIVNLLAYHVVKCMKTSFTCWQTYEGVVDGI